MKKLLVCLLCCSLPLFALAAPKRAYLDVEDDQFVSVFSGPGYDWQTCPIDPKCQPIGWPGNNAKIKVLTGQPKKMKMVDPDTFEVREEEFHKIEFEYEREVDGKKYYQKGTGWVDSSYLQYKKQQTFFGTKKKLTEDPCPPETAAAKNTKDLEDQATTLKNLSLTQTADLIAPLVGQCIAIGNAAERSVASLKNKSNTYDQLVLPKIKEEPVPKVLNADGEPMTQSQLVEIDSIARTLYGEMGGCFKHGLQYPYAVTRVLVNRSESKNRHAEFIRGTHDDSKSNITKVTTSATQLNVWLKEIDGEMNPTLKQALCPPQDQNKKFYRGQLPPKMETDIWKNAVRIATQAVLFPKDFKKRTAKVDVLFYTSNIKNFLGMTQVDRSVEGRPVSLDKCVQLWKE